MQLSQKIDHNVNMTNPNKNVTDLLIANGIITQEKGNELIRLAENRKDITLEEIITDQEIATDENLGILVADSLKLPFVSLSKIIVDKKALQLIPENLARKYQMVCYAQDAKSFSIALNNTDSELFVKRLQQKSGKEAKITYATKKDILQALSLYNDNLSQQIQAFIDLASHDESKLPQIVDTIITAAYNDKASDIHVEPSETESLVRFRLDGILHDILHLPKS